MIRRLLPLLLVALAACGDGSPATSASSTLPFRLADPAWPQDAQGMQVIMDALPDEIAGLPRQEAAWLTANYGDAAVTNPELQIYVVDLGGAECPGLSGVSLIRATIEEDGKMTIDESSTDPPPEGEPAYLLGTRKDGTAVAAWTVPRRKWVFVVEAPTADVRDAAAQIVVDAATAVGASGTTSASASAGAPE